MSYQNLKTLIYISILYKIKNKKKGNEEKKKNSNIRIFF